MFELFFEGGYVGMSLLTVELICLLFAAWKAPAWVREVGLLALATGALWQITGIYQILGILQQSEISPQLIAGGLRVSFIPTVFGLLIYALSLLLRLVQKPQI